MENLEFETDGNEFECTECAHKIKVLEVHEMARPVTCSKCSIVFMVSANPKGGLFVTLKMDSEPELTSQIEKQLED